MSKPDKTLAQLESNFVENNRGNGILYDGQEGIVISKNKVSGNSKHGMLMLMFRFVNIKSFYKAFMCQSRDNSRLPIKMPFVLVATAVTSKLRTNSVLYCISLAVVLKPSSHQWDKLIIRLCNRFQKHLIIIMMTSLRFNTSFLEARTYLFLMTIHSYSSFQVSPYSGRTRLPCRAI